MKVFVYWNLHKLVWSVKALEGKDKGRVIRHTKEITLYACTFKVSQAGRQRVLREQCKNVHAGVVGKWIGGTEGIAFKEYYFPVTYNPYKYETFVHRETQEPVMHAGCVYMTDNRSVVACN